jgi:hypothetical protein
MPLADTTKLKQFGLSDSEYKRLVTWMPELASELSPSAPVCRNENETRIGRKGSLCVFHDGGWYNFEADEGGWGPRSLVEHLRPGISSAELRQLVLAWLHTHSGCGIANATTESDACDRDTKHADFCRLVLNAIGAVANTPAQAYLESRGIYGDWPHHLIAFVDDERPGQGALVGIISNENGAPAGIQLGHLDALGRKLSIGGAERRQFLLDRATPGLGFHIVPTALDAACPLVVCEGLENALSIALAYPTAEIIGLPGIGRMRRLPPFAGRDIVVFSDGDAAGSPASRTLTAGIDHLLLGGARVKVTDTPPEADANSILQAGGIAAIQTLIEGAKLVALSPKGTIKQCSTLTELDYQLARRQHAKSIGLKLSALDHQVALERARCRGEAEETGNEDADIHPEPVDDIAAVLDVARAEIEQYVAGDPMQLDMVVMWALHTHFVHHATIDLAISPRLLISAPAAGCGKTTLLEASGELASRPLELSSISPAAFFRLADAERPTLLIDEIQGLLGRKGGNAELEGILNASHRRRSARTVRVEEQANKKLVTTTFDSWCTFAATISGRMSYAMESRCLKVTMRRALPGEVKKHLPNGTSEMLVDCRRKFARWAKDQLVLPDVSLPPALSNRHGDNWRALFKIAALVGGHWPAKIAAAAMAAMKGVSAPDHIGPLLLDIRAEMGQQMRLPTLELIQKLLAKQDPSADWHTCDRGRPINPYWLREQLKDVLTPPRAKPWKANGRVVHGYEAREFADAYERYLGEDEVDEQGSPADEEICAEMSESGKSSVSSATQTKSDHSFQGNSEVADAEKSSATVSATATVSVTKAALEVAVADTVMDGDQASVTRQYPRSRLNKSIPDSEVADVADFRPPATQKPQPNGKDIDAIDELW